VEGKKTCKEDREKYSSENILFSQDYASTYSIDLIIVCESTFSVIISHQREGLKV
jgi:hypothetical protein